MTTLPDLRARPAPDRRTARRGQALLGTCAVVVGGLCNLVVGVLALVWPGVTVVVLGVLLGVQILVFGAALLTASVFSGNRRAPSGVEESALPGVAS